MATLTISALAPEYQWWPDLVWRDWGTFNGTFSRSPTLYSASWNAGGADISVSFTGTGLTYSEGTFPEGGRPIAGTVTAMTIRVDGAVWMTVTGLNKPAADIDHFLSGFQRDGFYQNGDSYNFFSFLLDGNDLIKGSARGDDLIAGLNGGNDTVYGNGGDDFIKGDAGNDQIFGGAGQDTYSLNETFFDQTSKRGAVVNLATGTATDSWGGTDKLNSVENARGSRFSDQITGTGGSNQIEGLKGFDTLSGGAGFDTLRYDNDANHGGTRGVTVNLATGTARDGWGATDTISGFEEVRGTARSDTLTGNTSNNELQGMAGNDVLNGGGGDDTLVGALGADTMTGGAGRDSFVFGQWEGPQDPNDVIKDFVSGVDNLFFDTSTFPGMGTIVQFQNGTSAGGTGSWFFFDAASDGLYWDADGTGGGAAMLIVTLENVNSLSSADIILG